MQEHLVGEEKEHGIHTLWQTYTHYFSFIELTTISQTQDMQN